MARMKAVKPSVMTIAVSTRACGIGSLIGSSEAPMSGGAPAAPPMMRMSRLTPLPMRAMPMSTRVRLRSSTR